MDLLQDFGAAPGYQTSNLPREQSINSIESAQTVITEEPEKKDSLLPNKPPAEQYELQMYGFMLNNLSNFDTDSNFDFIATSLSPGA